MAENATWSWLFIGLCIMLIKKFSLNQLTIRTFTVFWLAFFAMTALLVALPYFDSRLYSDLNQNEISSYQKKLVESIRNN